MQQPWSADTILADWELPAFTVSCRCRQFAKMWQRRFVCRQKCGADNLCHFCTRMAAACDVVHLTGDGWKSKMGCSDLGCCVWHCISVTVPLFVERNSSRKSSEMRKLVFVRLARNMGPRTEVENGMLCSRQTGREKFQWG